MIFKWDFTEFTWDFTEFSWDLNLNLEMGYIVFTLKSFIVTL